MGGGGERKEGRLYNFFSFLNLREEGKGATLESGRHWFPVAHMHFLPPVASQARPSGGVFFRLEIGCLSQRPRTGPDGGLSASSSGGPRDHR